MRNYVFKGNCVGRNIGELNLSHTARWQTRNILKLVVFYKMHNVPTRLIIFTWFYSQIFAKRPRFKSPALKLKYKELLDSCLW